MAAPNSKATFKEYIKRALGHHVVEINIDDDQLDDRVDEALQYFRFVVNFANVRAWMT